MLSTYDSLKVAQIWSCWTINTYRVPIKSYHPSENREVSVIVANSANCRLVDRFLASLSTRREKLRRGTKFKKPFPGTEVRHR